MKLKLLDDNSMADVQTLCEDENLLYQEPYIATPITMLLKRQETESEREILHAENENLRKERDDALDKVTN